jgi:hypothetical protein
MVARFLGAQDVSAHGLFDNRQQTRLDHPPSWYRLGVPSEKIGGRLQAALFQPSESSPKKKPPSQSGVK